MAAAVATQEAQVVEGCPAFKEGCPFSGMNLNELPKIIDSIPKGVADKCTAFQEGCPFKESDSVETLYNKLSEMPATHRVGLDSGAAKAVEQILQMVHEQSKTLKVKLNAQCPVFATSCPFKTVTSDGALLVQELDGFVVAWGLTDSGEVRPRASSDSSNSEPLSKSLKAGTKTVHRAAENVRFVRDFLSGAVPCESYVELLRSLHTVYAALEKGLESLPPQLQHSDFAALRRTETLEADLRYYAKESGDALSFEPSPCAKQYAARLQQLAEERPLMLLAHAYTRYLGDLSGGQILARAATKAYGLPGDGRGSTFYTFESIGSSAQELKAFKRGYRAALDRLQLSVAEADELVEEANWSFLMNMLLFEERDVAAGHLAKVHSLEEVMTLVKHNTTPLGFQRAYGGDPSGGKQTAAKGVCPFLPASAKSDDASALVPSGKLAACPWPFLWFHDPQAAMIAHPAKNVGGLLGLMGLSTLAWHYPRSVGASVFGAGLTSIALKHRQHGSLMHVQALSVFLLAALPAAVSGRSGCPFRAL